jgi:hypothetical protein
VQTCFIQYKQAERDSYTAPDVISDSKPSIAQVFGETPSVLNAAVTGCGSLLLQPMESVSGTRLPVFKPTSSSKAARCETGHALSVITPTSACSPMLRATKKAFRPSSRERKHLE